MINYKRTLFILFFSGVGTTRPTEESYSTILTGRPYFSMSNIEAL
jgi:hypothetical protein